MVKKKNVIAWRRHYRRIENNEIEDDYTNHLLSHFGFYDQNTLKYMYRPK